MSRLILAAMVVALLSAAGAASGATVGDPVTSKLRSVAMRDGDFFWISGTRLACTETAATPSNGKPRAYVVGCRLTVATNRAAAVQPGSFGVEIGATFAQIERSGHVLRTERQRSHVTGVQIPLPTRQVQQGGAPADLAIPVGGTDVLCDLLRLDGTPSVACGPLSAVQFTNNTLNWFFAPDAYGVVLNAREAELVRWSSNAANPITPRDFRVVASQRQPRR
jgi:hypothetical protein